MTQRNVALLRELVLAATLAVGFGTLWCLFVLWLGSAIQSVWQGDSETWPPREELIVRSDGTPLIRSTPAYNLSLATCRDLNGRQQDDPGENYQRDGDDPRPSREVDTFRSHRDWRSRLKVFIVDTFWSHRDWGSRLKVFINEREPAVDWFLIHDGQRQGSAYFAGYERESCRRIGYIGLAGFRSDAVPLNERIPVRGEVAANDTNWGSSESRVWWRTNRTIKLDPGDVPPHLVYVPSGNQIRLVDLAARTISSIFETSEPIGSVAVPMMTSWSSGRAPKEASILVRTWQRIDVLDRSNRTRMAFTIPTELDRESLVIWHALGDGGGIAEFLPVKQNDDHAANVSERIVYRVGADGSVQDRFTLQLHVGGPPRSELIDNAQTVVALPVPVMLAALKIVSLITAGEPEIPWISIFGIAAISCVAALLAWRLCRTFAFGRAPALVWSLFVVVLGPCALVGLLLAAPLADPPSVPGLPCAGPARPRFLRGLRKTIPRTRALKEPRFLPESISRSTQASPGENEHGWSPHRQGTA